jgi:hypothetical protein
MLNDHAQYMSLKKLRLSASLFAGFFIKENATKQGKIPKTINKIMPGNKKSSKGEFFRMDKGKPPNNFPEGDKINAPPPPMALIPRNTKREI